MGSNRQKAEQRGFFSLSYWVLGLRALWCVQSVHFWSYWKCLALASFPVGIWILTGFLLLHRDADATRIDIYTGKSLLLLPCVLSVKLGVKTWVLATNVLCKSECICVHFCLSCAFASSKNSAFTSSLCKISFQLRSDNTKVGCLYWVFKKCAFTVHCCSIYLHAS